MNIQEIVKSKNEEMKKAAAEFVATHQRLIVELNKAEEKRDKAISKAQGELDAAILAEKLKDFPAKLVKEHVTCSICGGEMRPFSYADDKGLRKAWGCQFGSLAAEHDLVWI